MNSLKLLVIFTVFLLGTETSEAQFFKKLKKVLDKPLIKTSSKISDEELEKVKFPDTGILNEDAELLTIANKGLDKYFSKLSMNNERQYITSNRWATVKHKVTGIPLYQWAVGAVIQKNKDGQCMLQQFILRKDYTGGSKYDKAYFNGISRTTGVPYGSYCKCNAE